MSIEQKQRTYWHLGKLGRVPSDYDIGSTRLLYYPTRGFEVPTPVGAFYARHQQGSRLKWRDPERFRDPRETTYARYVELQKAQEIFVDGLLRALDDGAYDRGLDAAWVGTLGELLGVLRFPVHGLQMLAAYVGSMAPAGRVVITCALQAGDEMRRIQRLAYRLCQLRSTHPDAGADARARWQAEPAWQPLRRVLERLLVTYDWGEAFTGLALVLAPAFDELVLGHFGRLAAARGDDVLHKMFASLADDAAWHRAWAAAMTRCLLDEPGDNPGVMGEWIQRWTPEVEAAIEALGPLGGGDAAAALAGVRAAWTALHASAGLGATP